MNLPLLVWNYPLRASGLLPGAVQRRVGAPQPGEVEGRGCQGQLHAEKKR